MIQENDSLFFLLLVNFIQPQSEETIFARNIYSRMSNIFYLNIYTDYFDNPDEVA